MLPPRDIANIVKLLIEKGADINVKRNNGMDCVNRCFRNGPH